MKATSRQGCVHLQVFGCQMNKLDAELVKSLLHSEGFSFTEQAEEAGIILFITCSVREHAESRVHSRLGALKAWKREGGDAVLGVLGCMAQKDGEKLIKRHPHVDLVVGTRDFPRLVTLIDKARAGERGLVALDSQERPEVFRNEALRPHEFKAYLAIMRGCRMYCAYCVVPYVRGREESRPIAEVMEEADRLLSSGVREITLLGQTVNRYEDGEGRRLPDLIRRLDGLDGLMRLSFITSYPAFMDDELIRTMAEYRTVSRYLHLPVQSGSNRILKRMHRSYTAEFYLETVAKMREAMPDLALGTDLIVGFPGETEEDFQGTVKLMEAVRFQQSFIFKYSPRPGTVAAKKFNDDVPETVKKERNAKLLALQERISRERNEQLKGSLVEVLVEGVSPRDPNRYIGRTAYNQIVAFPGSRALTGRLVKIRVEETTPLTLLGSIVEEVIS